MKTGKIFILRKPLLYTCAFVAYSLFAFLMFPIFSLTVMLLSVVLVMLAAWLYGFTGCIFTTALTIPIHYLILIYYCDDPSMQNEAFNPFGIATQLLVSMLIATFRHAKLKIEAINAMLEQKISARTQELDRLRHYIVQNHETVQTVLGHMLLHDVGNALKKMAEKNDILVNKLAFEDNPTSARALILGSMIKNSINVVHNLDFFDHFFTDKDQGFESSVQATAKHFTETANTQFDLNIRIKNEAISMHTQHILFRITQEAITNAVRHAQASTIWIELYAHGNALHLSVVNDGIPMPEKIDGGLGIKLMQHRAHQLDGKMQLSSNSDGKTVLQCEVPLDAEAH
jgi:glucose-6-phosphate-specific signal transduction histidine kinase